MAEAEENKVESNNKTASLMISYSRKDKDFVKQLYDGLVERGFPPGKDSIWVDWEGIPLSADWMAEITKGIESANAFIFVISPDSIASEVCQREIEIAAAANKRFIPILYREPGKDAKLHEKISSHNWIFIKDEEELEKNLPALVDAINTDLDWLAKHTRFFSRASEWDDKGRNESYLVRGRDLQDAEAFISEGATGKDPAPTSLHVEYVKAAQNYAATIRRRNQIIAVVVGIALLGLSIFALIQRSDAIANYEVAVTQEAIAKDNEQAARAAEAEAQKQREVAEAKEAEARQKERVANANVLAAEAINQRNSDTQLSLMLALLSIQETELDGVILVESKSALFTSLNSPNVIHTWDNDGALVWAVAIDSASRYVAVGDIDGDVHIYDAESYELVRRIKFEESINALDFSPDGSRIGVATDVTASIWDVESGDEIFQLAGHDEYWVADIEFSPDGSLIATGGGDWNVRLWNADTGSLRTFLPGHEDSVTSVAFNSDGTRLVSGSDDDTAVLWDIESASFLNRFRPDGFDTEGNHIVSVAFDPWDSRIITGGYQTVVVWDADDSEEVFRLRGNQAEVYAVDFSPDGLSMLTASSGVKIWDRFYGTERYNLSSHHGEVTSAVFSEDGNYMLTGSWDNTSKLWSANLKIETLRLTQHDDLNLDADYSADGKWIVTTDGSGFVFVHDSETGDVIYAFEPAVDEWINAASFNPQNNQQLVTGDDTGQLQFWELGNTEPVWSVTAHDGFVYSAEFSPDGEFVLTSGSDGAVLLWDADTGELLREFFVEGTAQDAQFSPDGGRIVTADEANIGQVWNTDTGELIMNLEGHTDYVLTVAYSHDGRYIYTGGYDNTIRKWDAETGVSLLTLTGHTGRVFDIDVSPDDSLLVSGSADTTVKVWDAETGKEIFNYLGNNEDTRSVAFRPDGKRVLTASADNTSKEFTIDLDEILQIAQEYELRDLTEEECLRYLKRTSCKLHLFGQPVSDAPGGPGETPAIRSGDGTALVTLVVENDENFSVDVNWIDFDGLEKTYFTLAPGEFAEQGTYSTHVWRIRDADGNILLDYTMTEDPKQEILVSDLASSSSGEPEPDDGGDDSPTSSSGSFYTEEFDSDLGDSWINLLVNGEDRQVRTDFENGSLTIQLSEYEDKIPRYYLVNSDNVYSSVQLELTTTNNGNNANGVNLMCQYSEAGWYEFTVSNAGLYSINGYDPSTGYVQLAGGGSSDINTGRTTNTYTAICDGSDLALMINGVLVNSITDTRFNFTEGRIGVGVSFSPDDLLPVDVSLDTLTISEP
ncbi:MAG: TIR domain-containing protein [Anaerolineales bacterium]|nr:TIR domain-containing protein [Anaerolineales bacterium]